MKAIVYTRYGPPEVLQLAEVEKQTPGNHEVLVRVHATTVSAPDWRMRRPDPWLARLFMGLFRPKKKILGYEFAGDIESVGKDVKLFKQGDQVFGENVEGGIVKFGAYAEYLCMPAAGLIALKPANVSYEEAAAVPSGAMTALSCLRTAEVQRGQSILINGASGSIGTYAVQLARNLGADVTGVCSTGNLDMVKSLGANEVIDYTKEDFTGSGKSYEFIFDAVGKSSFRRCKSSLNRTGSYLSTGLGSFVPNLFFVAWTAVTGSTKRAKLNTTVHGLDDLLHLKGLLETGKLKPVIDRCYPLEQTAEAHRYTEKGHKKGNVVITVQHDCET
jgi:NADPH:quinone reductase-like Zn-dependent oxidoreductase